MMVNINNNMCLLVAFATCVVLQYHTASAMTNMTSTHNMTVHGTNMTGNGTHNMTGHGANMTEHGTHNMTGHGTNMTGHGTHNMTGHGTHNMTGHGHNNTDHSGHDHNNTDHSGHSGHDNHTTGDHDNHEGHETGHSSGHGSYFITQNSKVTLFFRDWFANSEKEYAGMCLVLGFLAIFYEGLKLCRQYLTKAQLAARGSGNSIFVNKHVGSSLPSDVSYSTSKCNRIMLHLLQTILHAVQVFIGYLLMLAFMTFNTYICVSVLAGFTLGYLMFGWVMPNLLISGDDTCCI